MRLLLMAALLPIALFGSGPGALLYNQGRVEGHDLFALLRGSGTSVPASSMSCAGCHGVRGEGTTEAGVVVPAILGRFSESELRQAVVEGIGRGGRMLHPAMPAYPLTDKEISDLAAHLHSLDAGDFGAPGVSLNVIRLGLALGTAGEFGDAVRQSVAAEFARVNEQGGIYGRRLELTSAQRNQGLQDTVLAMVATLDQTSASSAMPSVGPVFDVAANADTYTLLTSVADQISVLGEYARSHHLGRIYWIRDSSPLDREAADAWAELVEHGVITPSETKRGAEALLYTGTAAKLQQFLKEDTGSVVPVLTLHIVPEAEAFNWPQSHRDRLILACPALLPENFDGLSFNSTGVEQRYAATRAVAIASARVAIEALKRSGRDVTRNTPPRT